MQEKSTLILSNHVEKKRAVDGMSRRIEKAKVARLFRESEKRPETIGRGFDAGDISCISTGIETFPNTMQAVMVAWK